MGRDGFDRATPRAALRRGYWMEFWAAVYALTRAYPDPGLTGLVVAVLVVLGALLYDARPRPRGGAA